MDLGDIVSLGWQSHPDITVRIDLGQSAAKVETKMTTFLEACPNDAQPLPNAIPEWR